MADDLVTETPFLGNWKDALQPVAYILIERLSIIYLDEHEGAERRSLATAVLSEYAKYDVEELTELVSYSNEDVADLRSLS